MSTAVAVAKPLPRPMSMVDQYSIDEVMDQVNLIQHVMKRAMKDKEHYGTIPGCGDKPTLLKPGAEKLCFTFRLSPTLHIEKTELDRGHREYLVTCTMTHAPSGQVIGQGVGSCSTMESKYRYRNSKAFEVTDDPIPKDAKEKRAKYRSQGYGMQKVDGQWRWVRFTGGDKIENEDPADCYNTVLKMAKKRALVDAVLTCTAASDIFTQDVEDLADTEPSTPTRTVDAIDGVLDRLRSFSARLESCDSTECLDLVAADLGDYLHSLSKSQAAKHQAFVAQLRKAYKDNRASLASHVVDADEFPDMDMADE